MSFVAERLGVTDNEWFRIKLDYVPTNAQFRILSNGQFETEPKNLSRSSFAIMDAINDPSIVEKMPRFTENDIVSLVGVMLTYGSNVRLVRAVNSPNVIQVRDENNNAIGSIMSDTLFPNLPINVLSCKLKDIPILRGTFDWLWLTGEGITIEVSKR